MKNEEQNIEKQEGNVVLPYVSGLLPMSKDDEIGLYENFLDEFTDKEGQLVKCNPDAIFNWFGWQLWRSKQ
jgi:hypothetical protein